jgi:2-dehydro-3-deoxygluconokinase
MPKRIVCFGELLLRLSAPGRELLLQSAQLQAIVGGAEANVAVSLRRLGHETAVVSAAPDNTLGHACAAELRRQDVDVSGVRFEPGRLGLYFLTHGAMHRPAEVLYDRADSAFARAAAASYEWPSLLRGAHWLHISGITPAVSANAADAALAAMRCARANGVSVSFDCNFRARLWGARAAQAPQILSALAREADLLFAEARDIAFMFATDFGASDEHGGRAAAFAFDSLPNLRWMACTARQRETVDTQEYAGLLRTRAGLHTSKTYALSGIVDRIGAGDAFAAGLIDQMLNGADGEKAVEFATAAAVIKHSIPGDFNLATRDEIIAVMSELRTDVRR